MRRILDAAAAGGYGVGAFNVDGLEQLRALMEAARRTASPVIVQISAQHVEDALLVGLVHAAADAYAELPVALHLDHGSRDACFVAIDRGFTSVMIDDDVAVTRTVVERAHAARVTVEGEVGASESTRLTDPVAAVDFVERTGVDALAVAVGTSHGAYKRSEPPRGRVLALELIAELHERLPKTHLVVHGGSTIPPELVERINAFGGAVRRTWGVPPAELALAIRNGVRKINVDTDARLTMTAALRQALTERPREFDPRSYLDPATEAMRELYEDRMTAFGQAGRAPR